MKRISQKKKSQKRATGQTRVQGIKRDRPNLETKMWITRKSESGRTPANLRGDQKQTLMTNRKNQSPSQEERKLQSLNPVT